MQNDRITLATLNWAKSHDWGRYAYLRGFGPNTVIKGLRELISTPDDGSIECLVSFTSRKALLAWAGY